MSETNGLMIGKIVRVIRDLNMVTSGHEHCNMYKDELAIICDYSKFTSFGCFVKSLDGKRTTHGSLSVDGSDLNNHHFVLVGNMTKAIKILFEE